MKASYFKDDVIMAILRHTRSMFTPVLLVTIILNAFTIGILFTAGAAFLSRDVIMAVFEQQSAGMNAAFQSNDELVELLISSFENVNWTVFGVVVFISLIVFLIIGSWRTNFLLTWSDRDLLNDRVDTGEAIRSSFSSKIWRILGITVLLFLMAMILGIIVSVLANLSMLLGFVLLFGLLVVMGRFMATYSAAVHGDMNIMDAFRFSWQHLTWIRSVKLGFLMIASIIVFGIATLVMGLVVSVFGDTAAMVGNIVVNIVLNAAFAAFIYAGMSAMYFRYIDDSSDTGTEEHLLDGSEV